MPPKLEGDHHFSSQMIAIELLFNLTFQLQLQTKYQQLFSISIEILRLLLEFEIARSVRCLRVFFEIRVKIRNFFTCSGFVSRHLWIVLNHSSMG